LKKFFFDFCNFPVKALRQESRRGQPGLRGDSRGIAVQNDKRCSRRAGLSALSHRDAEPIQSRLRKRDSSAILGAGEPFWTDEAEKNHNRHCADQEKRALAKAMQEYNPDSSWSKVEEEPSQTTSGEKR